MASEGQIAEILTLLAAAYPRYEMSRETVRLYIRFLRDLPADLLQAAALEMPARSNFFPSVYELRQAATDLRREIEGIPAAAEAWGDLLEARDGKRSKIDEDEDGFHIRNFEYKWLHPFIPKVAKSLGWPKTFPGDNPSISYSQFVKAYEQAVADYLKAGLRLPEVTKYVNSQKRALLESGAREVAKALEGGGQ